MNIETKLKQIQDRMKASQKEMEDIAILIATVPDLEVTKDRWGHEYYSAKSVNTKATSAWFNHNCGCCNDSPLQMWPFIQVGGTQVHSSPMCFMVGERCIGCGGDKPYPSWEEELRDEGIPESVIEIGHNHFREEGCNGNCWDDEDDYEAEEEEY